MARMVEVKLIGDVAHNLQGSVDHVVNQLLDLKEFYGDRGYENLRIVPDHFGHDGAYDAVLYGDRPETDKERQRRIHKKKKQIADRRKKTLANELKERREYERLREKYEGK